MQTLTLNVPGPLYDRLKHRAQRSNRTVEDETIDLLAALVPVADELPADLAEAISPLSVLDDGSLWRAARATWRRRTPVGWRNCTGNASGKGWMTRKPGS